MSIAGKREGIKHKDKGDNETTRSGLFYEAIRIIKEMRKTTHGKYPKYAVWENVYGAFSSNKGEDFRCVLEEFTRICDEKSSIPRPADGKWRNAGEIVGDNFSIAWRLFDAQYWGVPQRRKRIYLVADFTGRCAGKILFEREGLRGHPAQGGETRQAITTDVAGSTGGSRDAGRVMSFKPGQGAKARSLGESETVTPTLNSVAGGNSVPSVCYPTVSTMAVRDFKSPRDIVVERSKSPRKYIIRRLTPLECCRLQGFPDGWGDLPEKENMADEEFAFWQAVRDTYARINSKATKSYTSSALLKWYNKLHTDSAEYKMWGNGIALPCAKFIMEGIAELCKED